MVTGTVGVDAKNVQSGSAGLATGMVYCRAAGGAHATVLE